MSMSPHQIFGRLQELKKWQHTHEKLLKRSDFDEDIEKTPLKRVYTSENSHRNLDEIKGSPGKEFEELLEEKLNEYSESLNPSVNDVRKPKKPYLKKGSGLLKYNLKPEEYKKLIGNKFSSTILPFKQRPKSVEAPSRSKEGTFNRPKTSGGEKHSKCLQKTQTANRTSQNSSQKPRSSINQRKPRDIPKIQNKNCIYKQQEPEKVIKYNGNQPNIEIVNLSEKPKVKDNDITKRTSPKLYDFIESISRKPEQFTPLKVPEISIKPKGNWCDISVNCHNEVSWKNPTVDNFEHNSIDSNSDKCSPQVAIESQWRNGVVRHINEFRSTMNQINNIEKKNAFHENEPLEVINGARKSLSYEFSDQSLYEKALETELMIFEALERRAEQSSFCSTNTSIIQLLASTPSKFNFKDVGTGSETPEFRKIIDSTDEIENQPVRDKIDERFEKASREIGIQQTVPSPKWRIEEGTQNYHKENESEIDQVEGIEENEQEVDKINFKPTRSVSITTDDLGMCGTIYSSDSSDESEYSVESKKANRYSRPPQTDKSSLNNSETCTSCGNLIKIKIEECESELNDLKQEKNRIVAIREQMAKEKKEFEKEMKTRRRQFEEQRIRFELELEEERKKISEKNSSEKSNKDTKSKIQHKKDREELNNLKLELHEAKELMKLRETKNSMCIARLRNQVKVLEKNNADLKAENEKLLKEKSKLSAQQKVYNKSTETKMLKEISKNISKLTEETFKNQNFKIETSSEEDSRRRLSRASCKGDSGNDCRKSLNKSHGVTASINSYHGHGEGPIKSSTTIQNVLKANNDNIEEKYKSLFSGQDVIIEDKVKTNVNHLRESTKPSGLGKSERILEDGTKEIRYSNGNMKLMSENGTVRYYYASNDTWHTNFPDGTEVIEFPNGQSEKRFKDGKCLVFFPDGLIQTIFPDGTEEVKYPDGSKLLTKKNGDRMLFLSNGQVEIHTKDQKRREYPDGTVKILYPDGSQETRYSNGRVRMKNCDGEIILDTERKLIEIL
ncbi:hypothetical protein HHI36_021437 [Cryptolaemus montrouzieri]|uniref:Centromere protein J C-terminal domain-containing protein n=1 Tax=Cryptolaemus montrouzieri TaxID=559131 RepID=A0ABD2MX39_9CUCU